jgi:arylsulfatase A-like enzyme
MFDSERAGSIVFFAAEGWDFSSDDPAGGHGSILAAEMRVPMLFAGPGLSPGGIVPFARTCDLMPTLLGLLGAEPILEDGSRVDIDGINLLPGSNPSEDR